MVEERHGLRTQRLNRQRTSSLNLKKFRPANSSSHLVLGIVRQELGVHAHLLSATGADISASDQLAGAINPHGDYYLEHDYAPLQANQGN